VPGVRGRRGQDSQGQLAVSLLTLVIYAGEPDEIRSMEVVDIAEAA
jgi:hypothetical protein